MTPPDRQRESLSGRTLRASSWRLTTVAIQAVLQLAVLAVLSRLVPPEEFGVLGIAMIFIAFGAMLQDLGVSGALIQRPRLTREHVRSAFFLSLLMGAGFAGALWLSASLAAELFRTPAVAPLLQLLSVSFLFSSAGFVSSAQLWRRMEAKKAGIAEVLGYLVGYGIVGIGGALLGYGVWALGWAVVVQSLVRSAAFIAWEPHDLLPVPQAQAVRELLGFGVGLSLIRLLNFAALKGDYVIVGRWLGIHSLGLYERAYRLMDIFSTHFAGVIERVLFPALSEIQDDLPALRRAFGAALGLVVFVYAPLGAVLCAVAPLLVSTLFGEAWTGAATPLRIMSLALVFRAGYKICDSLIRAKGAVYRSAFRSLIYAGAVVAGAWLGRHWGISGVALGVSAAILLKYLMVSHLCLRLLALPWSAYVRMHGPGVLAGGVAGAVAWGAATLASLVDAPAAAALGFVLLGSGLAGLLILCAFRLHWLDEDLRQAFRAVAHHLPWGGHLLVSLVGARIPARREEP